MLSSVIYVYNSIQCLHYTNLSLLVKALTDIFRYEAYICQASGFTGMKDNNRQLISFFLFDLPTTGRYTIVTRTGD